MVVRQGGGGTPENQRGIASFLCFPSLGSEGEDFVLVERPLLANALEARINGMPVLGDGATFGFVPAFLKLRTTLKHYPLGARLLLGRRSTPPPPPGAWCPGTAFPILDQNADPPGRGGGAWVGWWIQGPQAP